VGVCVTTWIRGVAVRLAHRVVVIVLITRGALVTLFAGVAGLTLASGFAAIVDAHFTLPAGQIRGVAIEHTLSVIVIVLISGGAISAVLPGVPFITLATPLSRFFHAVLMRSADEFITTFGCGGIDFSVGACLSGPINPCLSVPISVPISARSRVQFIIGIAAAV